MTQEWWSIANFVRLTCWLSFWTSTYIFLDAVRVSGSRLNDPRDANEIPVPRNMNTDEEKGNPTFPILVAVIFFLVSFNFGFDYF